MQILYRIILSNWNLSMTIGGRGHTGHTPEDVSYLRCSILTPQRGTDELAA